MESNWRFNVWNLGWSHSGIGLIARRLAGPTGGPFLSDIRFGNVALTLQAPLPGVPPGFSIFVACPDPNANFPYGFDVLAD